MPCSCSPPPFLWCKRKFLSLAWHQFYFLGIKHAQIHMPPGQSPAAVWLSTRQDLRWQFPPQLHSANLSLALKSGLPRPQRPVGGNKCWDASSKQDYFYCHCVSSTPMLRLLQLFWALLRQSSLSPGLPLTCSWSKVTMEVCGVSKLLVFLVPPSKHMESRVLAGPATKRHQQCAELSVIPEVSKWLLYVSGAGETSSPLEDLLHKL